MTRSPALARRAETLLGAAVVSTAAVAGGDVATATKIRLSNGTTALMKTLSGAPEALFAREAAGLEWLGGVEGGVRVPEVLAVAEDCLILSWVETGRGGGSPDAAARFGVELARTHAAGAAAYGGFGDRPDADLGFIGPLPMPQRPAATWAEFYATRRLLPYLKLARDRGNATPTHAATIEAVVGRLTDLVPEEGPARVHGDLWNGNVLWGPGDDVTVIDPAAFGGHREIDLATLALFGLPHLQRVLDAYDEAAPLADGWEDRIGLHQLFTLLVHACLFGGGYADRAAQVAGRYL